MDKIRYDLILGLGAACGCSMTLRRAGLQHLSFPSDWVTASWYDETHPLLLHDLRHRTTVLCQGLDGFFDESDFRFLQTHPWNGKDIYCNQKTQYIFTHDFPAGEPLSSSLPAVVDKYRRRYQRLVSLIRSSKRVLVVRMDVPSDSRPKATLDDCRFARQLLNETFAPTAFDFALISFEKDRPFERLTDERTEDGIYHYAFDFTNTAPGKDPLLPDLALTARLLSERFAVREYRTPEEITARKTASRQKKWSKVGACGPIDYCWKKAVLRIRKAFGGQQPHVG